MIRDTVIIQPANSQTSNGLSTSQFDHSISSATIQPIQSTLSTPLNGSSPNVRRKLLWSSKKDSLAKMDDPLVAVASASDSDSKSNKTGRERSLYVRTLEQLGYPDELRRDHDAWSLLGVCLANIGCIQGVLVGASSSITLGGSSMLTIGWPLSGCFVTIIAASLAELGSAYPVCGAMFTWVWKLCRATPRLKPASRFLSWVIGGFLICAHILTQVLICYQFATAMEGTIQLFFPDYRRALWRTLGMGMAEMFAIACVVSFPVSRSPWLWKIVLFEMMATFLIIVISLLAVNSDKLSASALFLSYSNETGWHSRAYVYLLGWQSTSIATGQDVAFHLAEETKEPARAVPIACFWSTLISYCVGWVIACVLLASVPASHFADAASTSIFPPVQILASNLSKPLAGVILVLVLLGMFAQGIAQLLASSRFVFALGRDKALPFSSYFSQVGNKTRIPYISVWACTAIVMSGLLLVAASPSAILTVILSAASLSITLAYGFPCFLYLLTKGRDVLDETGWRWTLRKASKPAAGISALVCLIIIVVSCFPTRHPITTVSIGWAPVIFAGVLSSSILTWMLYGNRHYAGPIKILLGPKIELPTYTTMPSNSRPLSESDAHGTTARVLYQSNEQGGKAINSQDVITADELTSYATSYTSGATSQCTSGSETGTEAEPRADQGV